METVQWVTNPTSYEIGLNHLSKIYEYQGNSAQYEQAVTKYIDYHKDLYNPIVYLEIPGYGLWESETDYKDKLRDGDEKESFEINQEGDANHFIVTYSKFKWNQAESIMNIARTLLVCVCLGGGSYIFQKDAEDLVLTPLENMIDTVRSISKKPMNLITLEEDERRENEMLESTKTKQNKKKKKDQSTRNKASENEALLLRYSLLQIGKLLGICFGFHGSEVVGLNISHSETGGDFTNELHGDGINNGIFGFC